MTKDIDELPFEIEGDEQERQKMILRMEWKIWKYFVGKSIIHPIWGRGTICKYVKGRRSNEIWEQECFIVNFDEHGEERIPLDALEMSLSKYNIKNK